MKDTEGASLNTKMPSSKSTKVDRTHSNVKILILLCSLFAAFVLSETAGALISLSLSLLGDAAAMSVDVFTYLCNIFAELTKSSGKRLSWKEKILIEVVVPAVSVTTLLAVTIYVTIRAIDVLLSPVDEHDSVDVNYLFGFAAANLIIDLVSSYLFCSMGGSDVFITYHDSIHRVEPHSFHLASTSVSRNTSRSASRSTSYDEDIHHQRSHHHQDQEQPQCRHGVMTTQSLPTIPEGPLSLPGSSTYHYGSLEMEQSRCPSHEDGNTVIGANDQHTAAITATTTDDEPVCETKANLNMISAFTHLGGDSVRTVSVLTAAIVSTNYDVPSQLCDAWAAVVVAVSVFLLAGFLIREIIHAYYRLLAEHSFSESYIQLSAPLQD